MCRKQLTDFFNTAVLHETLRKILDRLMSIGSPHHWINYIMPEDARFDKLATASSSDNEILSDVTKFDQLMMETHAVLARYLLCITFYSYGYRNE
jgi:peroxin-3